MLYRTTQETDQQQQVNRTNLEPTLDKQRRIANWIISIDQNLEPTNITNMEEVKESYRIVEKAIAALLAEIQSNPNHVNFLNFRPDAYQRKAEWLLSELKKNRANGAEEESQYLAFVQLYGDYKEELVKARKLVNTPAPEIDPGTVTPKKLEKVPAKNTRSSAKKAKPTVSPTLESTGNVLLDAHIAKKAANELKNIVPLDISDTSTVESTDSSFTTKPFELNDLFPENLKEKLSIALKKTPKGTSTPIPAKITTKTTPKAKLPVIEDSEDELMDNDPSSIPDSTTQSPESGKELKTVATNPETLLELSTQIKYLRDITFKTEKSQTKLCEIFEKSNLEFFPRLMQENNVALANTQREISNLSASLNLPVEKNNVPSTEHLNSLQDNITSSIRQDLITEVRVHNQKDNRNLTTMIEDKFNKLFERLDTIENKLQADLPISLRETLLICGKILLIR
ncbi:hypothetical protein MJO28_013057 [Puccinia striiformis f. sp. tritici]|uniref:Uncharacterized protein n=1 Tax=Puccinia striiformis f. sp. tritici TaxID=168172 RepID=A0ACC0DX92_9BASI|nr:hypothetical protein MJO28_013057 [Puccinia striiformis f. sp. tritici]